MSNKRPLLQKRPEQLQPQIKVNLDELERVKCECCEGLYFDIVWVIHKIPAMLSQSGKEALFPVAYFRCVDCGEMTKIIHSK